MKLFSLSDYPGVSFGEEVITLPSSPRHLIALTPEPPFFSSMLSSGDVASIEFSNGKLVISPSENASDVVFVNGLQLERPTDLWPGSRLALLHARVFFFVRPDPMMESELPLLVEKAALAAHLSLLRRRVVLVYHMDQQSLRIMRLDQQLARLEREADALGKQSNALETKAANTQKRIAGLRGQYDHLQALMEQERQEATFFERPVGAEKVADLKNQLKKAKRQSNDLELNLLEYKEESARCRGEEVKTNAEYVRVDGEKTEQESCVCECEKWLKQLGPSLRFSVQQMSEKDVKKMPTQKSLLEEFFPQSTEVLSDGQEEEEVDERPIADALFSDPKTFEAQRWLAHLLALRDIAAEMSHARREASKDSNNDVAGVIGTAEPLSRALGVESEQGALVLETVANASAGTPLPTSRDLVAESLPEESAAVVGELARAIAVRELMGARPLGVVEVGEEMTAVRQRQAVKAKHGLMVKPSQMRFAPKQRVTVYDGATGSWVTARVVQCWPTKCVVSLEDTKREVSVGNLSHVHDWLEHLRMHPHLFKAWKSRAPSTSTEPRDRATLLGFLVCPSEPQARRIEWARLMRPQFEKLVKKDPVVQKVFEAVQDRRPWSHRYPTWREERFNVGRPRLPKLPDDSKVSWVSMLAPLTLSPKRVDLSTDQKDERLGLGSSSSSSSSRTASKSPESTNGKKKTTKKKKKKIVDPKEVAAQAAREAVKRDEERVLAARLELKYFLVHPGNSQALEELRRISSQGLPRHLLIHGDDGSGKQSSVAQLVKKTVAAQIARAEQVPFDDGLNTDEGDDEADKLLDKYVSAGLTLELPLDLLKSDTALRAAITAFAKKPLHPHLYRRLAGAMEQQGGTAMAKVTRFVVLRNFETVAASLQMVLVHRLEMLEEWGMRLVLVAQDAKLVVGPLRASLLCLDLKCLPVHLWLQRLLTVCVAQRVGFDREGVQLVVQLANGDLGAAVDLVQHTFLNSAFVSRRNVEVAAAKLIAQKNALTAEARPNDPSQEKRGSKQPSQVEKADAPPRQALDPEKIKPRPVELKETLVLGRGLRCKVCTLPPPCKHISGTGLVALAKQRLKAMHQDPAMPLCPSFAGTGACESMNTLGYCRLHHPLGGEAFKYVPNVRRCPVCTTPEPCGVCAWLKLRRAVSRLVARAAEHLTDLKRKGERSSVTLARYRTLFDREVSACETILDDNAKWLNCSDRFQVASHMTDQHLVRGKYDTNENACRLRYEGLKTRWSLGQQKLTLWLSGQSTRHLATHTKHDDGEDEGRPHGGKYMAVADIASRRYMPSPTELVAESNGAALWEPPTEMPCEKALCFMNTAVLKMGLPPEKNTAESIAAYSQRKKGPSEDELKKAQAKELKSKADGGRKGISVFGGKGPRK